MLSDNQKNFIQSLGEINDTQGVRLAVEKLLKSNLLNTKEKELAREWLIKSSNFLPYNPDSIIHFAIDAELDDFGKLLVKELTAEQISEMFNCIGDTAPLNAIRFMQLGTAKALIEKLPVETLKQANRWNETPSILASSKTNLFSTAESPDDFIILKKLVEITNALNNKIDSKPVPALINKVLQLPKSNITKSRSSTAISSMIESIDASINQNNLRTHGSSVNHIRSSSLDGDFSHNM